MPFVASKYQADIFTEIESGHGSIIVEAVAGSGKSTTIKQCLLRIPEERFVQVFAFNTIIAKEMAEGVKELGLQNGRPFRNARVSTFHSVGFSALIKRLNRKPDVDGGKVRKILKDSLGDELYELYGDFCARLVGLAKGQGFGALVAADIKDWMELISHHDLSLDSEIATEEQAIAHARNTLHASNDLARNGIIDFDDMLYIPLLWKLKLWQNDWVFIDEAQDTNPVRRAIAKLALRPGGRLMAVGDRRQAIYGFTGASHDAMDLIKEEFACKELPLSVTYRCGRKIVELAKTLVPHLEAREGAHEGEVHHLPLKEVISRLQPTDAIMCRNTAPLVELAFKLVGQGVGCKVLGKEIGAGLASMVKKQRAKGLQNLLDKLNNYREREVAKHTAAGEERKAEAINDRIDCVRIIAASLDEKSRTIPALLAKIEGLFSDDDNGRKVLTLATLHKLKGKEYDRVALYRGELCPSKWARQEWQLLQEHNLLYVGYTRARNELYFIDEAA
jgi:superfamily I DNA/RNA helicase